MHLKETQFKAAMAPNSTYASYVNTVSNMLANSASSKGKEASRAWSRLDPYDDDLIDLGLGEEITIKLEGPVDKATSSSNSMPAKPAPTPVPKAKPAGFSFFSKHGLSSTAAAKKAEAPAVYSASGRKYTDPDKAAIVKALQDDATYDEKWTLCWEVNLSFMTKSSVQRSRCIKCNNPLADSDGNFHSGFVATATYADCGHSNRGAFCVCRDCDEDLLFDVSTVKVKCFEKGCKEELKVDRSIVTDKLSKERSGLLDEYANSSSDSNIIMDPTLTFLIVGARYLALLNSYHSDTFSCVICLLDVDRLKQPKGKIAPGCNHTESMCCTDCLQMMMDSAVRNAMWGDIKCPECNALLDSNGVRKFSSEEAYIKWEKFQLNKLLEGDEEFRWCPGQNFTCGHGQLHPDRDSQPRIICSECDTHSCFTCRVVWHRGQSCAEYQASLAISQSEALILKTTKRCPKRGCGVPIEKREACLEVSHKGGCNTNFCWDCKAIVNHDIPHSERVANRHFSTCRAMEVRHCDGVQYADKPPREGNDLYREGWEADPAYERSDLRDGAHMYCRGCDRERCTANNQQATATVTTTTTVNVTAPPPPIRPRVRIYTPTAEVAAAVAGIRANAGANQLRNRIPNRAPPPVPAPRRPPLSARRRFTPHRQQAANGPWRHQCRDLALLLAMALLYPFIAMYLGLGVAAGAAGAAASAAVMYIALKIKDSIVLITSSLPDTDDDVDAKRKPPPRVSEKARNVDRNETCILNHKFTGLDQEETLVFSLGTCSLDSVTHPDYLTISMLDERGLAELEINISRYSRTVAFNQQNPNETWKKEHICNLDELLEDGAANEIRIWTEEREAADGFRWREYMVSTPRRLIPTEIVRFGSSPKVRFLQIFERSDPPMLVQSHIEVSHYNHGADSMKEEEAGLDGATAVGSEVKGGDGGKNAEGDEGKMDARSSRRGSSKRGSPRMPPPEEKEESPENGRQY
ncbi:Cullin-9 [Drechslerella dactyloides]|uniref:RBR-type E3 ubiquitin transferase n=1 Tax=Drechslerella dactyloides TaxID=74499 RepID=A0AAD6IQD5_DREDA|nr:Cullin-9 [Drechslerella dactyloides]